MKSLLRKKTPTDNRQTPPPSSIQSTRQPSTIETPLYARFASIKPGLPPQDRPRPAVSGPMPLGRPNRANLDADENRKRHEQAVLLRHRSSSSRQEVPLGSQLLPGSLPRDVQSPLDAVHQDARVILTQAARLPIKAQTFSFSDERLASSKPRRTMATEKVQHSRDFLPSPPISPRSSHYPQQLMSASVYQPPSSSFPSGVKPHATVMGVSTIPIHVYGEPRLTTTLSADNPPPTSAPIYNATQPDPPEVCLLIHSSFSHVRLLSAPLL
ncbi:hypothetical protein B0F90DRAFT_429599 [Multifurca ochricompacta]|uniref:Uncharacterized protein n=1 Tax=Multifurca ochricompacta TaxID=376703 RepID=A0AAD4M3Z6_9AGAM|nr:hypothetical protein B0F90DRAFT_429599 [Multifurca ochricompacta]